MGWSRVGVLEGRSGVPWGWDVVIGAPDLFL